MAFSCSDANHVEPHLLAYPGGDGLIRHLGHCFRTGNFSTQSLDRKKKKKIIQLL